MRKINATVAGADWFVGRNNFVIGITNDKDEPQGGAEVVIELYDLSDPKKPALVGEFKALASTPGGGVEVKHTHTNGGIHTHGGQGDDRAGYFVTLDFPHAGFWGINVRAKLKDGTSGQSDVGFPVFDKAAMPAPGQAAKPSDNLTLKDVANVKEIDSGAPANDMHTVKIKDAIAAGRPVVVVFATPAYCTSRFCGPVVEEVEALNDIYKGRVDFVHIEIWKSFQTKELNPTAREWLLRPNGGLTEPVVYVIDKSGTIYDRWEGPVARNIMEQSVKDVAEGKTYR